MGITFSHIFIQSDVCSRSEYIITSDEPTELKFGTWYLRVDDIKPREPETNWTDIGIYFVPRSIGLYIDLGWSIDQRDAGTELWGGC